MAATWWTAARFGLPLTGADPAVGPWPLGEDAFLALWPTFFAERQPAPYAVTLALPDDIVGRCAGRLRAARPRRLGAVPRPGADGLAAA